MYTNKNKQTRLYVTRTHSLNIKWILLEWSYALSALSPGSKCWYQIHKSSFLFYIEIDTIVHGIIESG